MSASLRSPKPTGVRRPVPVPGQVRASDPPLTARDHEAPLDRGGLDGRVEWTAPAEGQERPSSRPSALKPHLSTKNLHTRRVRNDPGEVAEQVGLAGGWGRLSGRPATPESRFAAYAPHSLSTSGSPCGPREHAGQAAPAIGPERPGGSVPSGRRTRLGVRRGVAGLVAVCVLALGVAGCSVKDAKAEASASASASASAAIARAEKGIADANASATASREAALTPELRAKRDAALAEPAPAKPPQLNEESAEGAAASVGYFLDLYRYAFMTGNTTELAKMSEDGCKFCQSAISRATSLHTAGGWIDKWEQDVTNLTYYEKLEGRDYNRVTVVVDYGPMTSHPGDGGTAKTSAPDEGRNLNFGVRYVNGRWSVGGVEVVK